VIRRISVLFYLSGLLLAAGCDVNPLTPVPPPTATLPPAVVVAATYTLAPPTAVPATPVPSQPPATLAPTEALLVEMAEPASTTAPLDTGSLVAAATEPPAVVADPATAIPPVVVAPPVSADVAAGEQYTIDLINAQRANAGLPPLARDETIMGIARARVADMVARGYTGHNDPVTGEGLGRSMILAAGYRLAGENWYGTRSGPPATGEVAMNWFMTDALHANAILSTNFTVVGIGIAFNGSQWLLIQNFAAP
jgi:uncharacterized protein YkwD